MRQIRTNADLFEYLQNDAPQSFRSAANASGAELRNLGLYGNIEDRGRDGWIVSIHRKHGSTLLIAVVHGLKEPSCVWLPNTIGNYYGGDRDGPPNLTNGTQDGPY